MGTRHLIIIYYSGKYVLALYGQWDGYPEGQGLEIIHFLSIPGKFTTLKSNLHLLKAVNDDKLDAIVEECTQVDREIQRWLPYTSVRDFAYNRRYPGLSRETSAKILNIIADAEGNRPIFIHDIKKSLEFARESDCEWIYIFDLDANKLKCRVGGVAVSDVEFDTRSSEFDIEKLPGKEEFLRQIMGFEVGD